MVDRLLKPAIEMKELQEKYEFSLTLLFGHAIVGLNYDLTVFICVFFYFPFHRELDQLGYEKLIEMAYEKSKVNSLS